MRVVIIAHEHQNRQLRCKRALIVCLFMLLLFPSAMRGQTAAGVPVLEVTPVNSWMKFYVKSSTTIAGKFDQCEASLKFTSSDATAGVLEIKIQAASVDTGSGLKILSSSARIV
jgi:polyisoprenoid-binding protein YceI